MRYVYPKLKKIDSRDGECLCKVKLSGDIERIAKQVGPLLLVVQRGI